jgi:hypothetical protein
MPNSNDKDQNESAGERDARLLRNRTKESLEASFQKRFKEIESLRLYDLGEKEITPVDLKKFLDDDRSL